MDYLSNPLVILAITVVLVLLIIIIRSSTRKKNKDTVNLPFMLNDFLDAIGGLENINSVSSSLSKITLKLKENSKVNIGRVEELGASGIVETKDGFSFIFGNISRDLEELIKSKL
ncbi:PTS transporter subunit EIIB [Erysipelotrichaceae bacterium OttesenSCG-928-M19]|nr:PTS transporter subunit EIIB [Erysipelotrichaceae bacterium OttesenSCG-928-M19]